jgi:hypothetical protein
MKTPSISGDLPQAPFVYTASPPLTLYAFISMHTSTFPPNATAPLLFLQGILFLLSFSLI